MEPKKGDVGIFWFRRDLRITDNTGLYYALKSGLKVLPIFIFDKNILKKLSDTSDARVSFIHKQLIEINIELRKYRTSILTYNNYPIEVFKEIVSLYSIKEVYTNNDYEPYALQRDSEIARFLAERGIAFHSYKDHVIFEKDEILKSDGKPYTIYTPYMNQWKKKLNESDYTSFPSEDLLTNLYEIGNAACISLDELGFSKTHIEFPSPVPKEAIINEYDKLRDLPAFPTTKLGLHLRFGTVSIRNLLKRALILSNTWLNELIWRDFFQMIIYHFPDSAKNSFKSSYNRIEWQNNEQHFEKWCRGKTGFPLVDAGLRELNSTGFIHNRVRMVAASFLCKNLLIDWRWGEAYFAEKLLDYDLASNVGNWQWAAGSGCDAAPYFRVFNPIVQAEKFDKNCEYIRKWIPEIDLSSYPQPIVDIKLSAKNAIEVYKKALNS